MAACWCCFSWLFAFLMALTLIVGLHEPFDGELCFALDGGGSWTGGLSPSGVVGAVPALLRNERTFELNELELISEKLPGGRIGCCLTGESSLLGESDEPLLMLAALAGDGLLASALAASSCCLLILVELIDENADEDEEEDEEADVSDEGDVVDDDDGDEAADEVDDEDDEYWWAAPLTPSIGDDEEDEHEADDEDSGDKGGLLPIRATGCSFDWVACLLSRMTLLLLLVRGSALPRVTLFAFSRL
jgi:hypothetical protein